VKNGGGISCCLFLRRTITHATFLQMPDYHKRAKCATLESFSEQQTSKMVVFISHASIDKPIVDKFVDLLQTGINVSSNDIFCSSIEGLGIRRGVNFIDFIKSKLTEPGFVIPILTPCYYESIFCTCELGAAWALEQKIFPLIVPPLQYDDGLKAVLGGIQSGKINDPDTLNELITRVVDAGYGMKNWQRWDAKKRDFLVVLDTLPVHPATKVPRTEYESLKKEYDGLSETLRHSQEEIENLTSKNDKLKKKLKKKDEDDIVIVPAY